MASKPTPEQVEHVRKVLNGSRDATMHVLASRVSELDPHDTAKLMYQAAIYDGMLDVLDYMDGCEPTEHFMKLINQSTK